MRAIHADNAFRQRPRETHSAYAASACRQALSTNSQPKTQTADLELQSICQSSCGIAEVLAQEACRLMAGDVLFGFPCRQQLEALELTHTKAMVASASKTAMHCSNTAATSVT